MTVDDLINKLKQYDPHLPLVVQGYEGGFDDVAEAKDVRILENVNEEDYLGHHEQVGDMGGRPAILLVSNRRH